MAQKYRSWCFTINNWEDRHVDILKKLECRYIIVGEEVGESGTPHLQGYVYFNSQKTMKAVSKKIPNAHLEPTKGTPQQNREYCSKDKVIIEEGDIPKQGIRTDLNEAKKAIEDGKTVDDLCLENPTLFHQYGRTLTKIENILMNKKWRTEMTQGIWYFGKTEGGKSHMAFKDYHPDTHYTHPNDKGWWCRYRGQDTVILNDFRGTITYSEMLNLVDKWPHYVPRRGEPPIPFISKLVIVTSSLRPEEVYFNVHENDNLDQLYRRFKVVHWSRRNSDQM